MARSIQVIQNTILSGVTAQVSLSGLTSPSQTSIFNLWSYVTSVAIWVGESFQDIFTTQIEADIASAPVGTDAWVQAQSLLFQYDVSTPQVITLTDFVPSYNPVDVKVAKQNPPIALSPTELTSFAGYLDEISFAGVQYNATSYSGDNLMIGATVYYNGQYSSTITASTISAINSYMAAIPFDSYVRVSKIEDAIQSVQGVVDVEMNNVALRPYNTPFVSTTYLVQNNTELLTKSLLFAGYCIGETTTGQTLNDTLIFIPS
jgi:hypothetical protein